MSGYMYTVRSIVSTDMGCGETDWYDDGMNTTVQKEESGRMQQNMSTVEMSSTIKRANK
jgi:hypothetical protein